MLELKVLIVGGSGDVGTRLVRELSETGYETVVFDIAPRPERISGLEGVKMVKGNALNLSEIVSALKENEVTDCVVHLAAMLTRDIEPRPFEGVFVNMVGTATVLEACRLSDVERFIYASTSSIYGATPQGVVIDEDFPKHPGNIYGALKYAGELYADNYTRKFGIDYTACRLRLLFCAAQRANSGAWHRLKIRRLLDDLFSKEEAEFVGGPEDNIDLSHPRDVARAIRLMCQASQIPSRAYNIMTGNFTYGEIARAFEKSIPGSRISFESPMKERSISNKYDISRAERELGYEPSYTIDKIVEEIVEHEVKKHKTLE